MFGSFGRRSSILNADWTMSGPGIIRGRHRVGKDRHPALL